MRLLKEFLYFLQVFWEFAVTSSKLNDVFQSLSASGAAKVLMHGIQSLKLLFETYVVHLLRRSGFLRPWVFM